MENMYRVTSTFSRMTVFAKNADTAVDIFTSVYGVQELPYIKVYLIIDGQPTLVLNR